MDVESVHLVRGDLSVAFSVDDLTVSSIATCS